MARRRNLRRQVSLAVYLASALTLVAALALGGGPEWPGQQLLALAGVLLIVVSLARVATDRCDPERLRLMWLLPLALVALPLLQLIPLPEWLWSNLPGRPALLGSLAIAGAEISGWRPLSLFPLATEQMLWSTVVPVGIFMTAVSMRSAQRRRLAGIAIIFAGVSALWGFWQLMEGGDSPLYFYNFSNRGRATGFFANTNHLATLLAMSLPLLAGMLVDRIRHHQKSLHDLRVWIMVALFVLITVGVTATVSRAGYLLVMGALVGSGLVAWRMRQEVHLRAAQRWMRLGTVLAGLIVLQFTLSAILVRLEDNLIDRTRLYLAENTLAAADSADGVGLGLGTFLYAYDDIGDTAADVPGYVNMAHNDFLQLWLEGGVFAVLLALFGLGFLYRALRRSLREGAEDDEPDRGGDYRALQLGAALSLALVAIHSVVDYPLRTLAVSTYAALLVAIVMGSVRKARA